MVFFAETESPLGTMRVFADENGSLLKADILQRPGGAARPLACAGQSPVFSRERLEPVICQLNEYFKGCRSRFELTLNPSGTLFQQEVWSALTAIPYGATCSYKDVALQIGRPKACRAVGQAIGANPIPVIIPCHRVIGSNGSLTGFALGMDCKRMLLTLEGCFK